MLSRRRGRRPENRTFEQLNSFFLNGVGYGVQMGTKPQTLAFGLSDSPVGLAAWIILLHLGEIITWGLCYAWTGAMQGVQRALYFSAVTYTTTGYGDLTLPAAWRLVGAVEALTGILMCGLSTGFFFAVLSRLSQAPEPIAQTSQSASEPS